MRVRRSLHYRTVGMAASFALVILSLVALPLAAQETPTEEASWGAAEVNATEEAWDSMAAAQPTEDAWDNMASTEATAESSWDAAESETTLTLVWQTAFTPETALFSPGDIAIDKDGNVYVTTQSSNTVKKFDRDGNQLLEWGGGGKDDGEFTLSLGVGVDSENNVYVTDFYNHRIQKFDSNGTFLMQWATEPTTSPAFLAIDSQNNIYVDQFPPRDDNFVHKFDTWGSVLAKWGSENGEFGGQIEDIAVDSEGNLYVADFAKHRIQKLSPDGAVLASFGGTMNKEGKGLFANLIGVAVDAEGYIYVLDENFLQKLDWEGNFIVQWSTAEESGDLYKASNVAVDAEGYLYLFANSEVTAVNGSVISVPLLKKFQQSDS